MASMGTPKYKCLSLIDDFLSTTSVFVKYFKNSNITHFFLIQALPLRVKIVWENEKGPADPIKQFERQNFAESNGGRINQV